MPIESLAEAQNQGDMLIKLMARASDLSKNIAKWIFFWKTFFRRRFALLFFRALMYNIK
jgi:hypothetical protein